MKKLFIILALLVLPSVALADYTPPMDYTPDTLPHTYCFTDGSCYAGSLSGDDSTVTNVKDPSDQITPQSISYVCFQDVCYNLDKDGMIQ